MISPITKKAAAALLTKLESSRGNVGVFVTKGGGVRTTKVITALFRDMVRTNPETLMGVYNEEVLIPYLEEDLHFMGVR